jgi:hypothetical protein
MRLILLPLVLLLSSCSLTDFSSKDTIKTGATTAVTYAVAGPIPALINLGTSLAVDAVMPDNKPKIEDIKSNKQLVAYIWSEFKTMILYGAIIFLAFTTVITPWAVQRRARRKRKYDQYKHEAQLAREKDNGNL